MSKPRKQRKKQSTQPHNKHVNKMIITLTIVALVVAALGVFGFPYLKSLIWPISVEPNEISLQQNPWTIKTTSSVTNLRSDKTQYDVWIMLRFEDCDIDAKNISFEFPDLEDTISGTTGSVVANYDCVIIKGLDSQDKLVIFIILHHLLPSESFQFVTSIDTSQGFTGGKDPRISVKSIRHADAPVNLISQGNELAYPFTPPFSFTITSLSLRLKKQ
jgi:hypothetical protein